MSSAWNRRAGVPEGDKHVSTMIFSQGVCSLEKAGVRSCVHGGCMALILTVTPLLGSFPQSKTSMELLQHIMMWKSNCKKIIL